jgi:hypothetical protein
MSITIGKFVSRFSVPRRAQVSSDFVDRLIRRNFVLECSQQLRHLPAPPAQVIRIRRLALKVRITAGKLDEEKVAAVLAAEFLRLLLARLKSSVTERDQIVVSSTRTEWLAKFISDLVSGSAATRWEYDEFADLIQLGTAEAVVTVLQREPAELVPVLLLLDAEGRLEQLLLLLGDLALEQLFVSIATTSGESYTEPAVDDLLTVGALATSHSTVKGILATRRRALRLFLALSKLNQFTGGRGWTPRRILHLLMTLDVLVETTPAREPAMWLKQLSPEALQQSGRSLNPVVLALLEQVCSLASQAGDQVHDHKLTSLTQVLDELTPFTNEKRAARGKDYSWLSSDCAGLLLLVSLLDRLGWPLRILQTSLGLTHGPRAITFCLAGLGLRLMGHSLEANRLEPGICVFAGWTEPASADLASYRAFLSFVSDAERLELLKALDLAKEIDIDACRDWETTFDCLAAGLTREFAERVRGFRKAAAAYVIKTFFRQPGRICIEDKRILVILQNNPFHIALHISGMDESVESVSWLGHRRLDFQLEGL